MNDRVDKVSSDIAALVAARAALIGPGDCVISLEDHSEVYYFVVGRDGDELIALSLTTIKGGRFRPTGERVSMSAQKVIWIIGSPNEWSVQLSEADYQRLAKPE